MSGLIKLIKLCSLWTFVLATNYHENLNTGLSPFIILGPKRDRSVYTEILGCYRPSIYLFNELGNPGGLLYSLKSLKFAQIY